MPAAGLARVRCYPGASSARRRAAGARTGPADGLRRRRGRAARSSVDAHADQQGQAGGGAVVPGGQLGQARRAALQAQPARATSASSDRPTRAARRRAGSPRPPTYSGGTVTAGSSAGMSSVSARLPDVTGRPASSSGRTRSAASSRAPRCATRHPGGGELGRELAAHPDPEPQPAAGEDLQAGQLLGRPRRGAQAEQQDAEADADPRGHRRGGGQHGRGVEHRRRAGEVIPRPDPVEAERLGAPRRVGDRRRRTRAQRVKARQQDTPARGGPAQLRRRPRAAPRDRDRCRPTRAGS